jgi:hypothetical protein
LEVLRLLPVLSFLLLCPSPQSTVQFLHFYRINYHHKSYVSPKYTPIGLSIGQIRSQSANCFHCTSRIKLTYFRGIVFPVHPKRKMFIIRYKAIERCCSVPVRQFYPNKKPEKKKKKNPHHKPPEIIYILLLLSPFAIHFRTSTANFFGNCSKYCSICFSFVSFKSSFFTLRLGVLA